MNTLYIPPQYGLISTYDIDSREELCAILIKISKKVFNDFPPTILSAHAIILHICLMDPLDMPPQHIKTVPIHVGLKKIRSRPVILLIDSIPQAVPVSKFETCS